MRTYREDFKTTAELLYEATKKRMMSDRPIGTFLSGGLDSSIIAAFIKKYHLENGHDTNLNTFSVGLEGSPDLAYAKIVADHIKSTHHHVEIHTDDCLCRTYLNVALLQQLLQIRAMPIKYQRNQIVDHLPTPQR